jgi:hypothetical protein
VSCSPDAQLCLVIEKEEVTNMVQTRRWSRMGKSLAPAAVVALFALLSPSVAAAGTLQQVSSDTSTTNSGSQHQTEAEPGAFSVGSTEVDSFTTGVFAAAVGGGGGGPNIGFATSSNGGRSFDTGFLPNTTVDASPPGMYARVTDSSVAFDAKFGVWIITYLGVHPNGNTREIDVLDSTSKDGLFWNVPNAIIANGDLMDKPWTVCDNNPGSRFFGSCYAEFDDFTLAGRIDMSTSVDGGVTWGPAQRTADDALGVGGQPLVQPDGRVVVPILVSGPGSPITQLESFVSTNGGANWSSPVTITTIAFHQPAGGLVVSGVPSAETDGAGKVYVVWSDCRFEPGCTANDLVLSTSTDGVTWSPVTRIPLDPVGSGVDHFTPGLAVDSSTSGGSAHLALTFYFYPVANCTTSTCLLEVGTSTSADGGASWMPNNMVAGPMSLTWLATTTRGYFVGDYISSSFVGGAAYPAFVVAFPPTGATLDENIYTIKDGLRVSGSGTGG